MSTPTTQPSAPDTGASTRPSLKGIQAYAALKTYLRAADSAYDLTDANGNANKDFKPPEGLTVVAVSDPAKLKDGFSAVAYKDKAGNVLIAYEGTQTGPGPYCTGTHNADIGIYFGGQPNVLTHATSFARDIQQKTKGAVYVTGHSLGGIEAQAAAKALGDKCAGGVTFGACGLPGNTLAGPPSIINYVNHGDPVGNYASDANSPSRTDAPSAMQHFGQVIYKGAPADDAPLIAAAAQRQKARSEGFSTKALGDFWAADRQKLDVTSKYHGMKVYQANTQQDVDPTTAPTTMPTTMPTTRLSMLEQLRALSPCRLGIAGDQRASVIRQQGYNLDAVAMMATA